MREPGHRSRAARRAWSALKACAALGVAHCSHASPAPQRADTAAAHAQANGAAGAAGTSAPTGGGGEGGGTAEARREGDAGATSGEPAAEAGLLRLIDGIAQRVAQVRGLAIQRPIERGVMGRPEILARMRERVAEEYRPGEVELEGELNRRLGYVPDALEYERTVLDLLEEQIAGFYDPDRRRLYIAAWLPEALQTVTMAHEIDHALQDQHFDIARYTHHVRGGGDAQNAAMAVLEGDATVVMLEYGLQPAGRSVRSVPGIEQAFLAQTMDTDSQPRMAAAPRAVREMLLFPYVRGFSLCLRLYRERGDFSGVDELLRNAPVSTEQVLHPDKLASREAPIAIAAAVPAPLAADYEAVYDDVEGELGVQLFLEEGNDDALAAAGAAGWGGDRAVLLLPRSATSAAGTTGATSAVPQGADAAARRARLEQSAMLWSLVFDRGGSAGDAEAAEFERGALAVLARRYPRAAVRTVPGLVRALEIAPGRLAGLARAGRAVVVLDGVPADRASATARAALATLASNTPAEPAATPRRGGAAR